MGTAWDIERAVAEVGGRQHGAVARAQILATGASSSFIKRRTKVGAYDVPLPGVYLLPGYPDCYPQRLWVAHLAVGPGSIVSHEAAAALRDVPGYPHIPIELSADHPRHQHLPGIKVHQLGDVALHGTGPVHGLPVTTVPWTVVDLAAVTRRARLDAVLEELVIVHKRTTYEEVGRCLTSVAGRGKPGVALLTGLLDARRDGPVPTRSVLRDALMALMAEYGLPKPVVEFPHPGREIIDGTADAALVDCKVLLESDGRTWHTRVRNLANDRARDRAAARAGWETLRFLQEEILNAPDQVAADIRETRAIRLRMAA